MKLKHLVLDHNNVLVWCRPPLATNTASIHPGTDRQTQVLHSDQRDVEPFLSQNSGQVST